ncbi:MAG: sulfurtransferase TusA family protein [candidate division NC10 bacterium]|nr:sulfurtransferase TusA family protein [candidate division NC10 bacterium]
MTEKLAQGVHELDATGEICPYPLVMTQRAVKALKVGERLLVKVDYPKSSEDIPRWAAEVGHKVLEVRKVGEAEWEILIQRGE